MQSRQADLDDPDPGHTSTVGQHDWLIKTYAEHNHFIPFPDGTDKEQVLGNSRIKASLPCY